MKNLKKAVKVQYENYSIVFKWCRAIGSIFLFFFGCFGCFDYFWNLSSKISSSTKCLCCLTMLFVAWCVCWNILQIKFAFTSLIEFIFSIQNFVLASLDVFGFWCLSVFKNNTFTESSGVSFSGQTKGAILSNCRLETKSIISSAEECEE